ncbi:ABC transporter ATP-binding protein [Oleispirillum naphthae]|uniref:ABC transporter ATP-binding protein n=1 Tax=Oleispirillum naphthae TaxID=2838853 RepID=UPI00308258FF
MTAHLSVRDLRKSYGGMPVLSEVGFDIPQGEIAALIGPNGAGKSTLFSILGGALSADGGSVLLDGAAILGLAPEAVAKRGVGRTFQTSAPYRSLSVIENLLTIAAGGAGFWARLARPLAAWPRQPALAALSEVGLAEMADSPARALSYGDAKRLELAMALARGPALLLMDEPTAGMAPSERAAFMDMVRERSRARGMTVLFTEHDMATVFGFATRILVLDRGRLIADDAPEAIRGDALVRRAYLGSAPVPPTKPL